MLSQSNVQSAQLLTEHFVLAVLLFLGGTETTCLLILQEGGVFTFGAGGYGQLGHNSANHEINPRKVFELMGNVVTQISCGRYNL